MGTSETLVSTERAEYARKPAFQASGYNMLRAIRMEKGWSKIQIHWLSGSLHAPPHAANTVSPIRGMTFSHLSFNFLGGSPKAQLQQIVQIGESADQQFLPQKSVMLPAKRKFFQFSVVFLHVFHLNPSHMRFRDRLSIDTQHQVTF